MIFTVTSLYEATVAVVAVIAAFGSAVASLVTSSLLLTPALFLSIAQIPNPRMKLTRRWFLLIENAGTTR